MRDDTKVLLLFGGAVYVLTVGLGDLILRTAIAAGAYAGTRALTGHDLQKALDGLEAEIAQLPDDKRKSAVEAVRDKLARDDGTLRLAAFAVAAGTWLNPLGALAVGGVFAAHRFDARRRVKPRRRRMAEIKTQLEERRAARA